MFDHDDKDFEEEPQDSAAANSIHFAFAPVVVERTTTTTTITDQKTKATNGVVIPQTFHPVYTHQCFPGEHIPGYHPRIVPRYISNSTVTNHQHSSYLFVGVTHTIDIHIQWSPACDACCIVNLDTRPNKRLFEETINVATSTNDNDDDDNCFKFKNNISNNTEITNCTQNKRKNEEDSIELGSEDSEEEDDDDNDEDNTEQVALRYPQPKRLSEQEIRDQLQKFLPPIVASPDLLGTCSKPVGTIVNEFACRGMDFCITVGTGMDCATYHTAVQKLATWYIESASDIDPTEENGTAWKMIYLFRKHTPHEYSLCGYMTLYYFLSPFRKPVSGIVVRVCQALIVPPYQRMGHGKRLLHQVFQLCSKTMNSSSSTLASSNTSIVEVNVEDPAPSFSRLRDVVDWERFQQSGRSWFATTNGCSSSSEFAATTTQRRNENDNIEEEAFFTVLTESEATQVASQTFTTINQVHTIYELDRLFQLQQYLQSRMECDKNNNNTKNDPFLQLLEKRYRLMIKQRRYRQNREEIQLQCGKDKDAQKAVLATMFDRDYAYYCNLLNIKQ